MKILILALIAILAIANLQAQDSTQFTPNYGIELEGDSSLTWSKGDTILNTTSPKFMAAKFEETRLVFFYSIKEYNDTTLVHENKAKRIEVPLDAIVFNKKVYLWIEEIFAVDTPKVKILAEKLLLYDKRKK